MSNARENRLAIGLLAFIVVAAVGFFGYQFYLAPMKARGVQIADLQREVEDRQFRIDTIHANKSKLDSMVKISLPSNIELARRSYGDEIYKSLKDAGFEAGGITVTPKPPESRTSPTFANKKPIYTRLLFTVNAKGDLASLVDWMERFYKMRLLHQIRNLTVNVPPGGLIAANPGRPDGGRRSAGELDVTMTIEALVLDNAEKRTTLQPEKPAELPSLLAQPARQYASIAGKDIFFGPPPASTGGAATAGIDLTPFIRVDSITPTGTTPTVTLWDAYSNQDYRIEPHSLGGYRVTVSFYINGKKRELRSSRNLEVHDSRGELQWMWEIVRIDDREIILRDEEGYYRLRVGETLQDMMTPLKPDELKALGIKETIGAGPPKSGEKPADKEPGKNDGQPQPEKGSEPQTKAPQKGKTPGAN